MMTAPRALVLLLLLSSSHMTHMVQITHGKGQSSGRNGMEVQCNILEECGTSCTKMVAQGLCIKQACTLAQPGKYG